MRNSSERGIALLTTILVLMLMSALLVGFTTIVISDQRYRFIDRDRGQAFYAAAGAIEKLTGDLGNLFLTNVAPTAAQITALTAPAKQPSIAGVTYAMGNTPAPLPAGLFTRSGFAPARQAIRRRRICRFQSRLGRTRGWSRCRRRISST